jgi:hypothetical protein
MVTGVRIVLAISIAAVAATTACSSVAPPPKEPVKDPPLGRDVTIDDVEGYWSGASGHMILEQHLDGSIRGVYDRDGGTLVGTFDGDTVRGWWCEEPSRAPTQDAGDVELRFYVDPKGKRAIAGRWRYAGDSKWEDDWDLVWSESAPPAALAKRLGDDEAFCTRPKKK